MYTFIIIIYYLLKKRTESYVAYYEETVSHFIVVHCLFKKMELLKIN